MNQDWGIWAQYPPIDPGVDRSLWVPSSYGRHHINFNPFYHSPLPPPEPRSNPLVKSEWSEILGLYLYRNVIPVRKPPPTSKRCYICMTDYEGIEMVSKFQYSCHKCQMQACNTCLQELFCRATADESLMPPKCCSIISSLAVDLSPSQRASYRAKFEEWMTQNRLYCPYPRCSAFIPPRLIPKRAPYMKCQSCKQILCLKCKQQFHYGSCDANEPDTELKSSLKRLGYKRCPKCGHGLRRMYGCPHMRCVCGHHFCWNCLKPRRQCAGDCGGGSSHHEYEYEYEHEHEHEQTEEFPRTVTDNVPGISRTASPNVMSPTETPGSPMSLDEDSGYESMGEDDPNEPPHNDELEDLDATLLNEPDTGRDFGDEPSIGEAFAQPWTCKHHFRHPQAQNLQTMVEQNPTQNPPAQAELVVRSALECHRCWKQVYPPSDCPARAFEIRYGVQMFNEGRISKQVLNELVSGPDVTLKPTWWEWAAYIPRPMGGQGGGFAGTDHKPHALECELCGLVVCPDCLRLGDIITLSGRRWGSESRRMSLP